MSNGVISIQGQQYDTSTGGSYFIGPFTIPCSENHSEQQITLSLGDNTIYTPFYNGGGDDGPVNNGMIIIGNPSNDCSLKIRNGAGGTDSASIFIDPTGPPTLVSFDPNEIPSSYILDCGFSGSAPTIQVIFF
jgi:hypothetical protein